MNPIAPASERILYLDLLKILAIFGVITIHASADLVVRVASIDTTGWWLANLLNGGSRWAVPVFFMVTGALLLSPTKRTDTLEQVGRRIGRVGLPLLTWSLVYFLVDHLVFRNDMPAIGEALVKFAVDLVNDDIYVHFWFLYTLMTLYLVLPFVQNLARDLSSRLMALYVGLWALWSFVLPSVQAYGYSAGWTYVWPAWTHLPFFVGYTGYFVLGAYLHRFIEGPGVRVLAVGVGLVSLVTTLLGTWVLTHGKTVLDETLYGHFSLPTLGMALAVFLVVKGWKGISAFNPKARRLVSAMGNATLGVYLIHLLLARTLFAGFTDGDGTEWSRIAAMVGAVPLFYAVSFLIVKFLGLNKVPRRIFLGE